jgi:folate-binding Fe-S cluster repair protein YgfZ
LQGQLSSDINKIVDEQWQLNTYCQHQGRIIALMWVQNTKPLNPKMKPLTPKKSMSVYRLNHEPHIRSFRIMQVLNNEKIIFKS